MHDDDAPGTTSSSQNKTGTGGKNRRTKSPSPANSPDTGSDPNAAARRLAAQIAAQKAATAAETTPVKPASEDVEAGIDAIDPQGMRTRLTGILDIENAESAARLTAAVVAKGSGVAASATETSPTATTTAASGNIATSTAAPQARGWRLAGQDEIFPGGCHFQLNMSGERWVFEPLGTAPSPGDPPPPGIVSPQAPPRGNGEDGTHGDSGVGPADEEPDGEYGLPPLPRPLARNIIGDVVSSEIEAILDPPLPWAYGKFLLFGSAAVIGAQDGVGKGFVAVGMIIAFITGHSILGERIWRKGLVTILTYEDQEHIWRRRIRAACMHYQKQYPDIDFANIMANIRFLTRNGEGKVSFAEEVDRHIEHPHSDAIIQHLSNDKAVLLLVDPFNSSHGLQDGNSNVQIVRVAEEMSRVADKTKAVVLVLHHLRKGAVGDPDDLMGAIMLRANFRACRILTRMTRDEANSLGIEENERRRYFRITGTKENYAPPPDEVVWFKLESIDLGNATEEYPDGDNIAVATRWKTPKMFEGMSDAELREVFRALEAKPHAPDQRRGPKAKPGQGKQKPNKRSDKKEDTALPWAGQPLMDLGKRNEAQAKKIITTWRESGVLVDTTVENKSRHKVKAVVLDRGKAQAILNDLSRGLDDA
jgi:hypothetical protein